MNIKVSNCAECPFVGIGWCMAADENEYINVDEQVIEKTIHPDCPLKKESVTVELDTPRTPVEKSNL